VDKHLITALLLLATCLCVGKHALADDSQLVGVTNDAEITPPRPGNGYWSDAKPRLFLSTHSELGLPYAKPYFSAGYGTPHWIWAGVDVNAIATPEFWQGYFGLRAATPILDVAFGARDTGSFDKPFITPAPLLTRDLVRAHAGPRARYWAWEAEIVATAPLPHSALVADFIAVRTLDVPAGRYVFEESYRAVVKNPQFFVLRWAAVARLGNENALKLAVLTECVFGTGRGQAVWRIGPAGALQLTDHLEAVAALTLNVAGPDSLGLVLGAYGVAGLRYRWATGEKKPALPWSGILIP
jgi:hypothetical protein